MVHDMMCLLENQLTEHSNTLLATLEYWSEKEADLKLISIDGTEIQTHKIFLQLYSSVLNNSIAELPSESTPTIFIPVSTSSLINLMKILSTGLSISDKREDLLEVVKTAEVLGIALKDIQIGTRQLGVSTIKIEGKESVSKETKKKKPKRSKNKKDLVQVGNIKVENGEDADENSMPIDDESLNSENESSENLENNGQKSLPSAEDGSLPEESNATSVKSESSPIVKTLSQLDSNCPECGKYFEKRDKLKRHFIIHTGEKPFECDDCDKKFGRKDKLTNHKKSKHSDNVVTGLECYLCDKSHGSKWHLNRHLEKAHNVEIAVE